MSYSVLSSIDGGHTRTVTDIMWIPEHLEVIMNILIDGQIDGWINENQMDEWLYCLQICLKTFNFIYNKKNFTCQLLSSSLDG